ncbi:MAG: cell wall metabolism sensor histidine kinase WalK, partial [Candidatus Omnitrophica bacterium]|nr:cell wall metabolism sensor histidine kinase WalK [Candidatus Omnitrophota bacterium]
DLLDLAKIESGKLSLELESLDLVQLIKEITPIFRRPMEEKKITLKNHITLPCLPQPLADRGKIRQVLVNLLDNAVKFNTEGGSIILRAQILENQIKILIEDSGIGIPEKSIPRIFERFYRVDKNRSRELGGTGLGLSIVKHIIEAHGGNVFCESTFGRGSTFSFTLPVHPQQPS